ncbi:hypothetical protein BE73_14325 [Xanthomonas oryzae pv. oryzicola]|nr:hypothetical protein BE73_14325 [Xanthomonas oryzae pv. oryzicola]
MDDVGRRLRLVQVRGQDRQQWNHGPVLLRLLPPRGIEAHQVGATVDLEDLQVQRRVAATASAQAHEQIGPDVLRHWSVEQAHDLLPRTIVGVGVADGRQLDERHLADLAALPCSVHGRLADAQHTPRVPLAEFLVTKPAQKVLLARDRHVGHGCIRPKELTPQRAAALGAVLARQLVAVLRHVPG